MNDAHGHKGEDGEGGLLLHHRKIVGDENWSWSRSFSGGEWADRHTTEARRGKKRRAALKRWGMGREWGKEEILLYVQKERRERLVLFAMGWKFQGWKKQNENIC